MKSARPVLGLDVDGVLVLEDPPDIQTQHVRLSAWGRWSRDVEIPLSAQETVAELASTFEIVWVSAWGHNAHTSLATALGLPDETWTFLPVQFGQALAIAEYAQGRPWALVNDGTDRDVQAPSEGVVVHVNPHRGLADLDVGSLVVRTSNIAAHRERDQQGSPEQENKS